MYDVTLRLIVATIFGIMLIAAGLVGRPGSIFGSLIDAPHMELSYGGGASGDF